jgi:tRNA-dihydrouridine synthase A
VPPLDYQRVYRLKAARPELEIVINGGIGNLAEAATHLAHVDGVMLGRAAYQDPWLLAGVDEAIYGASGAGPRSRAEVVAGLLPYAQRHLAAGGRLNNIARHILGLYHGRPRARAFRRHLSEKAVAPGAGVEVLTTALAIAEGGPARACAAQ